MKFDPIALVTQVLAWMLLVLYIGLFVWGVRVAGGQGSDNDLFNYFGTGLATLVVGVVAAEFGVPTRANGRSVLLVGYAIVYFGTGVWAIITWLNHGSITPVLIRTMATGTFGLAVAIVGAYLNPRTVLRQ